MKIVIHLSTDERLALRRLANERDASLDDAAAIALRDWLMANGYLEMEHVLDEDTVTGGQA